MNREIINSVLDEKASLEEAGQVAEWFATEEGQVDLMDRAFAELDAICPKEGITAPTTHHHTSIWWRVAAVVIPAICILGGLTLLSARYDLFGNSIQREVCTTRGEHKQVVLQDGTMIYLNAGSTLSFPEKFALLKRTITIEGEAYFEVSKQPHRPFVVQLNDGQIEVLGTKFNVQSYASNKETKVLLDEGKISFTTKENQQVLLRPGEMIAYNRSANKITVSTPLYASSFSAWKDDRVEWHDMPLADALKYIENQYGVSSVVSSKDCYSYSFTLSMNDANVEGLAACMHRVSPLKVLYNVNQNTIIVSKK